MRDMIRRFGGNQDGATSIEYALIAAFVGLVIIASAVSIGTELIGIFTDVKNGFRPS
jgi:Flp pilus assembly pilin Flp